MLDIVLNILLILLAITLYLSVGLVLAIGVSIFYQNLNKNDYLIIITFWPVWFLIKSSIIIVEKIHENTNSILEKRKKNKETKNENT